jgi:hypothetical protein
VTADRAALVELKVKGRAEMEQLKGVAKQRAITPEMIDQVSRAVFGCFAAGILLFASGVSGRDFQQLPHPQRDQCGPAHVARLSGSVDRGEQRRIDAEHHACGFDRRGLSPGSGTGPAVCDRHRIRVGGVDRTGHLKVFGPGHFCIAFEWFYFAHNVPAPEAQQTGSADRVSGDDEDSNLVIQFKYDFDFETRTRAAHGDEPLACGLGRIAIHNPFAFGPPHAMLTNRLLVRVNPSKVIPHEKSIHFFQENASVK